MNLIDVGNLLSNFQPFVLKKKKINAIEGKILDCKFIYPLDFMSKKIKRKQ